MFCSRIKWRRKICLNVGLCALRGHKILEFSLIMYASSDITVLRLCSVDPKTKRWLALCRDDIHWTTVLHHHELGSHVKMNKLVLFSRLRSNWKYDCFYYYWSSFGNNIKWILQYGVKAWHVEHMHCFHLNIFRHIDILALTFYGYN